jgi:hypothetical protein
MKWVTFHIIPMNKIIDLKSFTNNESVLVTYRNGQMIKGTIEQRNTLLQLNGFHGYPILFKNRCYSPDGLVLIQGQTDFDIVNITTIGDS